MNGAFLGLGQVKRKRVGGKFEIVVGEYQLG
jgi:hypothetical protein